MKQDIQVFSKCMGVREPWSITSLELDETGMQLLVHIDFARGSRFAVEGHPDKLPVHGTSVRTYLNGWCGAYQLKLVARVPRVLLPDGRTKAVHPPWEGLVRDVTKMFEAKVLSMLADAPISAVAKHTGASPYQVRQIGLRYMEQALARRDLSRVRQVAIDETSRRRGHLYVTIVADAERRQVVAVLDGRDRQVLKKFAAILAKHGGRPQQVKTFVMDMSPAFISGVAEYFRWAQVCYDKFHTVQLATRALDATRRTEQKVAPELKGSRWLLLRSEDKMSAAQRNDLRLLQTTITTRLTARAWHLREELRDILNRKQPNIVDKMLRRWIGRVRRSKVVAMHQVADTIDKHFSGVVEWARSRLTNAYMESINGLFQAARSKARGYRDHQTMQLVIFLLAGKLNFSNQNPYVH